MSKFNLKDFHLDMGDFALFISNKGLASPKIDKKDRPLLVRCVGNLEEGLSSAKHIILRLRDSFGNQSYVEVIGTYLSPWKKFPATDRYHDPTIFLPNIEVICNQVEPMSYNASDVSFGIFDICDALRKLKGYELYADLINSQLSKSKVGDVSV